MSKGKLKVLLVFGTRPEAIKMAPVYIALNKVPEIHPVVCVTAQHRNMLDDVLSVFGIVPAYDLNIMKNGQTLESITSSVLEGVSRILYEVCPDVVLVHGDTTTTFAASLACFYHKIPVGHVEAGLRTNDLYSPWPEEFNRRVCDLISDIMWAPTHNAAFALEKEGFSSNKIYITGNTVIDALLYAQKRINAEDKLRNEIWKTLPTINADQRLILVTAHRRENFVGGISGICQALNLISRRRDVVVIWPVHPNPAVTSVVEKELTPSTNLFIIEPQGYLSFVALMMRATLILTDSGGIQEEAPALGKPVLVTRDRTERSEAVAAGTARLVGTSTSSICNAVYELLDNPLTYAKMSNALNPYGDGSAASRIVEDLIRRYGIRRDVL